MKRIIILSIIFLSSFSLKAQIGYGTNQPNPSSILHLYAADSAKGLIIPIVKTGSIAASPAIRGMIVYNATDGCIKFCTGTTWECLVDNTVTGLTDDQNIDSIRLNGKILTTYIENGTSASVNLQPIIDSAIASIIVTDDQNLSVTAGGAKSSIIDIEGGNDVTVNVGSGLSISETANSFTIVNIGDTNAADDYVFTFDVNAGNIRLIDGAGTKTIPLAAIGDGTGTDDQNIDSIRLNGKILTTYIENGTSASVNLQPIIDSAVANVVTSDDQNLSVTAGGAKSSIIDIEGGNDVTVNVGSGLSISETANSFTIVNIGDTNAADDYVTTFDLNGGNIRLIDGAGTKTIPLAAIGDGTGTDDQNIDSIRLNGKILTTYIENGTSASVNLQPIIDSAVANVVTSDDQNLSVTAGGAKSSIIDIEGGNDVTVNVGSGLSISETANSFTIVNIGDTNAADDYVTTFDVNAGNIRLIDGAGTKTIPLTSVNTDAQALSVGAGAGNTSVINISGNASTVTLTAGTGLSIAEAGNVITLTNTGDLSASNEYNTGFDTLGGNIRIIDGGGTRTIPLSALGDGTGTDDQNLSVTAGGAKSSVIDIEGGNDVTVNVGSGLSISETANSFTIVNIGDTNAADDYVTTFDINAGNIRLIDGAGTKTIPLTSINTDAQALSVAAGTGTTSIIGISGNASTVTLSAGSNITLAEVGNVITISAPLAGAGTDDQNLSVLAGTATTSIIDIEDGDSIIIEAGTNVSLSETGNKITISATDTDAQALSVGAGAGNTSVINISGNASTVTLTAGSGLSIAEAGNVITLTNSGDTNPADDYVTTFDINAGNIRLIDGAGTKTIPISSINSDAQALSVGAGAGNTSVINISGNASTVTLTAGTGLSIAEVGNVITLTNSGDTNPADDYVTTFDINAGNIRLIDGAGTKTIPISSIGGGDITDVVAGTGLTGGGTTGSVTLDVVADNGLTANANDIDLGGTLNQETVLLGMASIGGEVDVFTIDDPDVGGAGQDHSSSFKVIKSGSIDPGALGQSIVELTYTGGAGSPNTYYIAGRKADEGAVEWGVDLNDNDYWSTGGIVLGVTGAATGSYSGGNFIVNPTGQTGIGTTSPTVGTMLDVVGKTRTTTFQLTTAPVNNYVLTSDASGNGSWTDINSLVSGDISAVTAGAGLIGGGTSGAVTIDVVADNGLTANANDIDLGGALNQATTITQGNNAMIFDLTGTGDFEVRDNGATNFYVKDDGNVGFGTANPLYQVSALETIPGDATDNIVFVDGNTSPAAALTANRTHSGIYMDYDATDIVGTTTNGQRHYVYGIRSEVTSNGTTSGYDYQAARNVLTHNSSGDMTVMTGAFNYTQTNNNAASSGNVGSMYGSSNNVVINPNSTGTVSNAYGAYNYIGNNNTNTLANARGSYNYVYNINTGTINNAYGDYTYVRNAAGTISNAFGNYTSMQQATAGGTIGNSYAYYAGQTNTAGTSTNSYLYYGTFSGTHANKWGLNINNETYNYLSGNLGVGVASPSDKLEVAGKTKTTTFQMTTAPTANYVLTSDAAGNGSWVNPNTLVSGDNLGNHTATTTLNLATNDITNVNLLSATATSTYDKIRVWNSGSYSIGMASAQSYGFLNDYAMTFTMSTTANRGWLWRDVSDAANDGAMSLTTDGRLTVKSSVRLEDLAGTGNRMVVANASGLLSTQAIPVDTDAQALSVGAGAGNTSIINISGSASSVTLQAGTNVTLAEAGNVITISAAGDITGVTAGDGLTGGGTTGTLVIDVVGNNGLTATANDVRLGGSLIAATTIAMGANAMNFTSTGGAFNVDANTLYVDATNNRVGIGLAAPTYTLHVNGRMKSNGLNETSDIRYKKEIKDLPNMLDKVMKLRGVSYKWRKDEFPAMDFEDGTQLGVIAQEIEAIFPEVVYTDDTGYKSVDYSHLVPVLIQAIKEQQAEISELKKVNEKVYRLEKLVEELTKNRE